MEQLQARATHLTARTDGDPLAADEDGHQSAENYEAIFLEHLSYVEHVIAYIARRHALNPWDADDFGGWVKLRLIQDDYNVLRKFKGQSKLSTFLTTVINNLYRDFRIQRWGKWRASAAAKRLGDVGVQLETLLYRDHYSLSEAIRVLRENYEVGVSRLELEDMAAELRPRLDRRFETEEALLQAASGDDIESNLLARERRERWAEVLRSTRDRVRRLGSEDRMILRLRFDDGLTVAAIARELGLDQRRLYARVDRLLKELRLDLERKRPRVERRARPRPQLAPAAT